MGLVTGNVRTTRGVADGVLIEVFSVDRRFQDRLPIADRRALSETCPTRLGSALTGEGGRFSIEYAHPSQRRRSWFSGNQPIHLWLTVSAVGSDKKLAIVHQELDVRHNAGPVETFTILIDEQTVAGDAQPVADANAITADELKANVKAQSGLSAEVLEFWKESQAEKTRVRSRFREEVAPDLRKELSTVSDDAESDPEFVSADASVRAHAEERIKSELDRTLSAEASEPMVLSGRVSLTPAQLAKVEAAGEVDGETVKITDTEIDRILSEDGEGTNPESRQASISRVDAVREFCRTKTKGERCLDEEPGRGTDGEGGEDDPTEVPLTDPKDSDGADLNGGGVTKEGLEGQLASYIASVLDEKSVLDPGFDGLPGPGTQLDVTSETTFPSLTLPPGPADVPAFYDFHELQIAFKPVWMEALDESIIDEVETAYERYVDLGGDPQILRNADWSTAIHALGVTLSVVQSPPPVVVTRYIEIDSEEWNALPAAHRSQISVIATDIDNLYAKYKGHKIGSHDLGDGVGKDDLVAFERSHKYIETKVLDLTAQAQRIVRFARNELERRSGTTSPVPTHRILTSLKSRALSQYPAKYFAANRRERSVNFGLLITYRQRWEPTVYQAGELIKSIPLAPKEVRKYSKKIVIKEKRARKELESNVESQKSETDSTLRAEAEIVQRAMDKTNFSATASGSFKIGIADVSGSSTLSQDAESNSAETKKSFHGAVVKAAREYKSELKVEIETESSFESEFEESGEIVNPNDELTVTYLFYELQRRYRVTERLQRLTSVVLVAQEVPRPADIDEDWLISNRWILNRVLLDDSFQQPLNYVAEGLVAEEHALHELRKSLMQQRSLVEDLKEDLTESRELTESRYSALQRSMERSAKATQSSKSGGGLFGFAKKLTSLDAVTSFADRLFGGEDESPEAARIREAATRDAYEREIQRMRDLEGRLTGANSSLSRATDEFTMRISTHLSNVVLVSELKNHVKDNIVHYMQAIWLHEPEDQRWLRLKDVPVPVFKRSFRYLFLDRAALNNSLANVAHLGTRTHGFTATPDIDPRPPSGELPTVPLYQVADLDSLLGFRANYMIFSMKKANALTDFMMEPFVERAAGAFGITDPDDLGNMTLDEFSDYVCCLKENLEAEEFDALKETLNGQLKKLLQSPLRDNEEIVVPLDAMFIEAIPGSHPILENFKLLHRQIDAAKAQEELRMNKLEKLRYAQRLLSDELDDPEADARYVFEGTTAASVIAPNPDDGGGDS